jgi:hypothetical protein
MKNKLFSIVFFALILCSCNSNSDKQENVVYKTERDTASINSSGDSVLTVINHPSLWTVEMQSNAGTERLKKPSIEIIKSFNPSQLIDTLNDNYKDIQLHLLKLSHDTIYVAIPDSKKLTQELGDTGAENYMATVVFNLTELKNIKFVNFYFKAGDHAEPGVFSREDFKRLR